MCDRNPTQTVTVFRYVEYTECGELVTPVPLCGSGSDACRWRHAVIRCHSRSPALIMLFVYVIFLLLVRHQSVLCYFQNKEPEKLPESSRMLISMAKENIPPNRQRSGPLGTVPTFCMSSRAN